jgi:hypothetical protein
VSWSLRVTSEATAKVPACARPGKGQLFAARLAEPRDALALSLLDATLATRRRAQGDRRYDRPRAVDAATVGAIAAQLNQSNQDAGRTGDTLLHLVTADSEGRVRGAATFAVNTLDPPFRAGRRAVLGRFTADPALDTELLVAPLIALGRRIAAQAETCTVELTDLTPPSSALYRVGVASGGVPWSCILTRPAQLRTPF